MCRPTTNWYRTFHSCVTRARLIRRRVTFMLNGRSDYSKPVYRVSVFVTESCIISEGAGWFSGNAVRVDVHATSKRANSTVLLAVLTGSFHGGPAFLKTSIVICVSRLNHGIHLNITLNFSFYITIHILRPHYKEQLYASRSRSLTPVVAGRIFVYVIIPCCKISLIRRSGGTYCLRLQSEFGFGVC
jgi:hypothetical protein